MNTKAYFFTFLLTLITISGAIEASQNSNQKPRGQSPRTVVLGFKGAPSAQTVEQICKEVASWRQENHKQEKHTAGVTARLGTKSPSAPTSPTKKK